MMIKSTLTRLGAQNRQFLIQRGLIQETGPKCLWTPPVKGTPVKKVDCLFVKGEKPICGLFNQI